VTAPSQSSFKELQVQPAESKVEANQGASVGKKLVPAPTRKAAPAFEHAINVVANCVPGIHAAKPLHEKAVVFRVPVADGRHHRRS